MKRTLNERRLADELKQRELQRGSDQELWRVPWKDFGFAYCGVYLICQRTRWPVKIGISECASRRLSGLQSSHWSELMVGRYWLCESRRWAKEVETAAHDRLESGHRLLGEWFDIDIEKAASVVEFSAQVVGVELATGIPETDKYKEVLDYLSFARSERIQKAYNAHNKALLAEGKI